MTSNAATATSAQAGRPDLAGFGSLDQPNSGPNVDVRMLGFFSEPVLTRTWPIWARYGVTTALVLSVLGLKLWSWPYLAGYPFLFFNLCIIVSAALFDRGSGILAAVLSAVATDYFFLAPRNSIVIEGSENIVAWIVFLVVGLAVASIIEAMHVAVHRLHEANKALDKEHREKDLLMRESAHRIGNDLQILGALVDIQMRSTEEAEARAALASTANRIRLIGRVQQRLRLSEESSLVDAREFIEELCNDLRETLIGGRSVSLRLDIERHNLSQQRALALGLVINELLTNALKYGFPYEESGLVEIHFCRRNDDFHLLVRDNGVGIASRSGTVGGTGFGHRLLKAMAAQLGGRCDLASDIGGQGTVVTLKFPVDPRAGNGR